MGFVDVDSQYKELRSQYPYLFLNKDENVFRISGTIVINVAELNDAFEIEIVIDKEYPLKPPFVRDLDSKIPKDYHRIKGGYFCLETPYTLNQIFKQQPTLLYFVNELVIPYLFNYHMFQKTGIMPFGQRNHGITGIMDDFKNRLNANDDITVIKLIQMLVEDNYRGHYDCPCGSKKRIRNCHADKLLKLKVEGYNFMEDYLMMVFSVKDKVNIVPLISKKARQFIKEKGDSPKPDKL
ncbi:MAG: hypothetical protein A2536_06435 [Candidatus Firestonebacteria bacterium RIFOXYD2_FULL_39_29]|nr:MAG: hypothetical protein A2536_06435 [Candidatus Firestonebacteria bacterium RIFOXYD2_FULL_39_29]